MQGLLDRLQEMPLVARLGEQYDRLSDNDQRALQAMLFFVAVVLLYMLVWKPVSHWSVEQYQAYSREVGTYGWITDNAARFEALRKKQEQAGKKRKGIAAVTSASARQAGLSVARVQPDKGGVSVWVENVPYQVLLGWVVTLHNQYQIDVSQIRIDRAEEDGQVKAYLHLSY